MATQKINTNITMPDPPPVEQVDDAPAIKQIPDDATFISGLLAQMLAGTLSASQADNKMLERYASKPASERQKFAETLTRAQLFSDRLAQNTTNFQQWEARRG